MLENISKYPVLFFISSIFAYFQVHKEELVDPDQLEKLEPLVPLVLVEGLVQLEPLVQPVPLVLLEELVLLDRLDRRETEVLTDPQVFLAPLDVQRGPAGPTEATGGLGPACMLDQEVSTKQEVSTSYCRIEN